MNKSSKTITVILLLILALTGVGYKAYEFRSQLLVIHENSDPDPYHTQQYAEANINILKQKSKKVVLVGDSIIYGWKFPNTINEYLLINRGINGERTDELIGRFTNDVIKIKPQYVVILIGINDAATMYEADPTGVDLQIQKIVSNITLMAENAKEAGISPVICSILPVNEQYRLPAQDINQIVRELNHELELVSKSEGFIYADFYTGVADENTGMLKSGYSKDGLHPSESGYQQMWTVLAPLLGAGHDV